MWVISSFKKVIKAIANKLGVDIVKQKNSPSVTLLGLRDIPFNTIIDVGANNGQFAKKISRIFPHARLYCFEPLPEPFKYLSVWAGKKKGRVVPLNIAIGDKEDEVEMFLHENHTPSSSILPTTQLTEKYYPLTKGQKRISVRQMTLDSALESEGAELSSEILVKLDVQGYEDRVLSGASILLGKALACIVEVSLDNLYENQASFRELLAMFDDLGYRYCGNLEQAYGDDGHCIYLDALFLNNSKLNG